MSFGDVAPCKIEYIHESMNDDHQESKKDPNGVFVLNRGQVLRPEFFSSFPFKSINGYFYFRALQSPIIFSIHSCLNHSRPETVIASKLRLLGMAFSFKIIWIVFILSFIVNSIRWKYHSSSAIYGLEFFINLQFYVLLPLVPLAYPTMLLLIKIKKM